VEYYKAKSTMQATTKYGLKIHNDLLQVQNKFYKVVLDMQEFSKEASTLSISLEE
jgi:hypothetical protein